MRYTITHNMRKTIKAHLKAHYLCIYCKCKTTLVFQIKLKNSPSSIETKEHHKKNTTIKPNLQHRRKRIFNFKGGEQDPTWPQEKPFKWQQGLGAIHDFVQGEAQYIICKVVPHRVALTTLNIILCAHKKHNPNKEVSLSK